MMAGFHLHSVCAHCCDKKKGKDPCVEKPDSDCQHCKVLTPEHLAQLSTVTLSCKLKKEKRDKSDTTPSKNPSSSSLVTSVGNKGSGWPGNWFECTAG